MLTATDLLQPLLVATEKGRLRWKPTAEEDIFRTFLPTDECVRIAWVRFCDQYQLTLIGGDGVTLEDAQLTSAVAKPLFVAARRQALDVDAKLRAIFDCLKESAESLPAAPTG